MAPLRHLELLVEERSMEEAMRLLLPAIVPGLSFAIHPHQGKRDLLVRLPARLAGYRRRLPPGWGIVVLVDRDRADCRRLKARLEGVAAGAGLVTRTAAAGSPFAVCNWLAVEELEAWLLGDDQALFEAYPGVRSIAGKRGFRDPDAVAGGTWEALERVLQAAGHHQGGLNKVAAARAIAARMEPARNRSRSFQGLCRRLVGWKSVRRAR
jgi:hypothetical protein